MTDHLPDPQEHPLPRRLFDKQSFSVNFTLITGKNHRIILIFLLVLALTAMAAGLAVRQSQQSAGLLELVAIVSRLPQEEQVKPIACSRAPIADGPDKAALQEVVLRLAQPTQRATAYCLLGDVPSAMAAYAQAASNGDEESALQVYFLQARQGDMQVAKQALNSIHFSDKELQAFFTSVINLKSNIDLLPVAQRMAELYPGNPDSWKLWRDAAQEYERASNWQSALDAYLEAIRVQNKLGVRIGRSSFELAAGIIVQFRLKPPDLNSALSYYNAAIADMDFLNAANPSNVFLYRGEVYQGLSPAYTASQALQEFMRSLELDPKNMWAMRAIAGVYLSNFKNYPLAEQYINQAIGVNPDLPDNYLTLGDVHRQQGDLKAAVAAYEDALARKPGWQAAIDRLTAVQAELLKKSH